MGKKRPIALKVSIILTIIIAGCSQIESENVESVKEETPQIEAAIPESKGVGSKQAKQEQTENLMLEPNDVNQLTMRPAPEAIISEEATTKASKTTKEESNKPKPRSRVSFYDKCVFILEKFVNDDGMVDYSNLRRQRLELKQLLQEFDELSPEEYEAWPREDKIAFWINVYNMQMLNIIVENYPIDASRILSLIWGPYSIRHIKGIWTDYKIIVMDEEFTLREIEQRFFQREFNEPRVYLGITYSSMSGPRLRNEPYYGYKLEEQLDDQVKRFLAGHGYRIDPDKAIVYLSAIFEPSWHGDEFVKKFGIDRKFKEQTPETRAVLNFILHYISEHDVRFLEVEKYTIKYTKYDWTLNDSSRR